MDLPHHIETGRLYLRRPTVADAAALVANWVCDEVATRYMLFPVYAPGDVAAAETFLRTCEVAWQTRTGHRAWVLVERSDATDTAIGMVGVTPDAAPHRCEIGYILGRAWWGRGYVPEAVRAVVGCLFGDSRVWRVYARAHVDNRASQRVFDKVGFVHEGTLRRYHVFPRVGDEPQPTVEWAITRDDLETAGY